MIGLLRALFASPEAERDPEAWALRLAAHAGLGAALWLLLAWTGPAWATGLVGAALGAWEAVQWQGGRRMAFDGLLDLMAGVIPAVGLYAVAHHQTAAAVGCGFALVAVMAAGVGKRR